MDIRPIATEDDYEAVLAEIKRLWSAEAGSPDAAKAEVLAMLAQSCERARAPLPKSDPVKAIKLSFAWSSRG
jgi:HTH-type transcriptional regulator/antitoxin HigA